MLDKLDTGFRMKCKTWMKSNCTICSTVTNSDAKHILVCTKTLCIVVFYDFKPLYKNMQNENNARRRCTVLMVGSRSLYDNVSTTYIRVLNDVGRRAWMQAGNGFERGSHGLFQGNIHILGRKDYVKS